MTLALHSRVIAGLVPAIHRATRSSARPVEPWITGTSPVMTMCEIDDQAAAIQEVGK